VRKLLSAVLLCACAPLALATPITYDVSDQAGSFSVSGTITTDGTIGALSGGDIIGWSLTIDNGASSTSFVKGFRDAAVEGTALTASASSLLFDFDDQQGGFEIDDPDSTATYCVVGIGCSGFGSAGLVLVDAAGDFMGSARSGEQILASIASTETVPEPASIALLFAGAGASLTVARRRRRIA
jgi:hypothetical protein